MSAAKKAELEADSSATPSDIPPALAAAIEADSKAAAAAVEAGGGISPFMTGAAEPGVLGLGGEPQFRWYEDEIIPFESLDHRTPNPPVDRVKGSYVWVRARVASVFDVASGRNVRLQIAGVGDIMARYEDLELVGLEGEPIPAPPPTPPAEGGQP